MSELPTFDYEHDGVRLRGRLALPAGDGPHPGVLVMHSAHGLGAHDCERARRLADAGYAALATDMYGGGTAPHDPAEIGALFAALQDSPARLRGRAAAGLAAFRALPQVDDGRIGAIGFCLGGQCVLELARSGAALRGVVSFHGLLATKAPARAGEVRARVLAITGARDPYAPPEDVQAFQAEMAAADADWQLTIYGKGEHAFSDSRAEVVTPRPGIRYDAMLDELSWSQATAFLDATVRRAA